MLLEFKLRVVRRRSGGGGAVGPSLAIQAKVNACWYSAMSILKDKIDHGIFWGPWVGLVLKLPISIEF